MKRCTDHGRRICLACVLQTAIFPIEHVLWARVIGPLVGVAL